MLEGGGTGDAGQLLDLARAERSACDAEGGQGVGRAAGQCGEDTGGDGVSSGQDESDSGLGLGVDGVGQTAGTHLGIDAPDSFSEFLGNSEVGANPGYARIARVPGDVEEIARIDESRESAGADDLHAVREGSPAIE